jgi:hypothetical protein
MKLILDDYSSARIAWRYYAKVSPGLYQDTAEDRIKARQNLKNTKIKNLNLTALVKVISEVNAEQLEQIRMAAEIMSVARK